MTVGRVLLLFALAHACAPSKADDAADSGVPGDAAESPDTGGPNDSGDRMDAGTEDQSVDAEMDAEPRDSEMEDAGEPPARSLVFVGTGEWGASAGRITTYRFDASRSELARTATIAAGDLASFLAFDPVRGIVHVADEGGGRVLSFAIISEDGHLRLLDERPARGFPVHVTMTAARDHLLVAHYNEGRTEVFGVQQNGAVDDATDLVTSGGQSHSVAVSPDDRFVLVPAKDADWIAQYVFDASDGSLTENSPARVMTTPGAGPRHFAFHPDGLHAYVINELGNTVDAYDYDPSSGTLTHRQTISALPSNFSGQATGADIHVHPNGRFLYASERVIGAQGLIAIFGIGADGMLSPIGHEPTRGEIPRNFTLTPDGGHLLVGNQFSSTVAIFTVDRSSGMLSFVGEENVGGPPFFVGVLE